MKSKIVAAAAWLGKRPELGGCLTCSDAASFEATGNDANSRGGNCLEFTFPVSGAPEQPAARAALYECHTILKIAELDGYREGCIGPVMHSTINHKISGATLADIKLQICSFLGCDDEALIINACDEVGRIDAQTLEGGDGYAASVSDLAAWELGECELFSCTYSFYFERVQREPAVFTDDPGKV